MANMEQKTTSKFRYRENGDGCRGIRHDRVKTFTTVASGGEHKVGRIASQMPLCGRFFYHVEPRLVRIEIVAHVYQPGERNATEAMATISIAANHRRARTPSADGSARIIETNPRDGRCFAIWTRT
jgi:hypothetical protein